MGEGEEWVWREDRVQRLLDTEDAPLLFISGCARNMVGFYPRFDHIVLLAAPPEVLVERLATRTTNTYGKTPEELAPGPRQPAQRRTPPPPPRHAGAGRGTRPLDDLVEALANLAPNP